MFFRFFSHLCKILLIVKVVIESLFFNTFCFLEQYKVYKKFSSTVCFRKHILSKHAIFSPHSMVVFCKPFRKGKNIVFSLLILNKICKKEENNVFSPDFFDVQKTL